MHIAVLAIGAAIGLILIFLGLLGEKKTPTLLLAGALFLVISGILLGADGLQYPTEAEMMASYENSYVWDGYCNVTDLFPAILSVYPNAVSIEDGTYVSGALNPDIREIDQDYYIIEENGANFNITWNFTWIAYECPEHLHWTGRYSAPSNREFTWYVYNWTADEFQMTPHNSVGASTIDQSFQYGQACQIDFVEIGTHNMMLKMVSSNSASNGVMYTDMIVIDTETDSYAEETRIINCTRDQYNTTYSYGTNSDTQGNIGGNYAGGWALMLILVGVACSFIAYTSFMFGPDKKQE